jgi:hypothetical protein
MIQPVANLKVCITFSLKTHNAVFALEFGEPAVNPLSGVLIIGVKKTREHSRGRASPPRIVADGPNKDETKPRFTAHPPHAFALRKLGFDGSDSRH